MRKVHINPEGAPKPIGSLTQSLRLGDLLFLSGVIGTDPATGRLAGPGTDLQAKAAIRHIQILLAAHKAGPTSILKVTIYLADIEDAGVVTGAWGCFVQEPYPARTLVAVNGLPAGARVAIDVVAAV